MWKLNGRVALLIIILAAPIFAQSGRPTKKNSPAPTPDPTPPPVQARTEKTAEPIQILLGIDGPNVYDNPPYYISKSVFEACIERLNHAREVAIIPMTDPISRQEAIKKAKQQTGKYMVWLEVGNNASETGRSSPEDASEFFVGYIIFEPQTAKVKKGGRRRHRTDQAENGEILRPGSSRGLRNAERVYKEAGYAVAERILEIFGVRP